jgi:hypothetical protein
MEQGGNPAGQNHLGWRCATCGALIRSIEDGWVEWLATESEQGDVALKGLRLVHRYVRSGRCHYDFQQEFRKNGTIAEGLPLERFVGPDGLMLLLSFLAAGNIARDDLLELTKRVQIPGYEQTRELFQEAQEEGVITPAIGEGYYLQLEIQTLLQWTSKRRGAVKER